LGLVFGVTQVWSSQWWLAQSSALAWIASGWVAIFPAALGAIISSQCWKRKNGEIPWQGPIIWAAAWMGLEWIRTALIPYGWNPWASVTGNLVLLQNAWWGGQYAPGFFLALASGTMALCALPKKMASWKTKTVATASAGALIGAALTHGAMRLSSSPSLEDSTRVLTVRLFGTKEASNPALGARWTGLRNNIRKTLVETRDIPSLWPEALGFPLMHHQGAWDKIDGMLENYQGQVLINAPYPEGKAIYNATFLLRRGKSGVEAQIHRKKYLTPFGEGRPFWFPKKWTVSGGEAPTWMPRIGDRDPAPSGKDGRIVVLESEGKSFKAAILTCLEETLPQAWREASEQGAEVVIAPSNHSITSWGGACAGQQERMARIQAIAWQLPLLRPANMGIASAFDSRGRELGRKEAEGTLTIRVPLPE
jgi:apolipoprotein N-acyltransferase